MITPALTPEEWAKGEVSVGMCGSLDRDAYVLLDDCGQGAMSDDLPRHATAALCLHGQPFGFTREDVDLLRTVAGDNAKYIATLHDRAQFQALDKHETRLHAKLIAKARLAKGLADRIEALLPPEAV